MSIRVENIQRSFGAFKALDGVTLDFPTGELVALLGPSGCGKTTLLRIIAGLDFADSGRILLDGEDASSTHVRERKVGFVFQHYALFRHMTVFENVAFGLRVKRKDRPADKVIRAKVTELLKLVQLDWLADRYPSQLSGGQRQRIALARALAVGPSVLLLDEPFGALDAKVRKELRRWLRRLHDELHITSIFVTHDQEEALELADRVVVMNRGKVEQVGAAEDVYSNPATPFVYEFLGAVNEFRGNVVGEGLQVGTDVIPQVGRGFGNGQQVVGFARPHELDIVVDHANTNIGVPARVSRILSFGPVARIELSRLNGGGQTTEQQYEVQLPAQRLAELQLTTGQAVRLLSSRLRLFDQGSVK
ncbi:sulfate ABC transporter ATP-binding protein [Hyphomicrobium sp. D-2]|uniref:sulfate/molybdate ABC transporter ATP-binding protein n=1 Tax=Hyphomicrobium sp. D-2 TaxID=3041621 RepID=UPI0024551F4A|nr:sulfate ABC transporter ATP-binding protein [Hyphomicrobium sp. D-2]MDH4981712.1 sulfate ABC transporter ATP-binding protein [Hyphomicrobium sp. D-2]